MQNKQNQSTYTSNISRTKIQNSNVPRLELELALPSPLKQRVKSRMKM